jgi:competence protein ComEC
MPTELAAFSDATPRAMPYQPFVLLLAAVTLGMVLDRYWTVPPLAWFAVAAAMSAAWLGSWLRNWQQLASCSLLCAAAAIGGAWHHDQWRLVQADEVGLAVTEEIRPLACEAIALTSPRWSPAPPLHAMRTVPKGDETEFLVWVTRVRRGATWEPASGYARVDVDGHLLGVRAGDRLRLLVLASQPMKPLNPGDFDYAAYERSRRVFCRMRGLFPESIAVVEQGSFWSWRLWLSQVREAGNTLLRRHISPRRSTLAAAILLGAREQLDPERNEGFLVTGTIHVLSISGLHVGIMAYGFWLLFRTGFFPRRAMLWSAIVLTTAYCLLTDWQPPIVRATILVVIVCCGLLWGRVAIGFHSLAFAGLMVLWLQPAALFQAGPQLSFLSVAAMIYFAPWLTKSPIVDPLDRLIHESRSWPNRLARFLGGEIYRTWLTGAVVFFVTLPIVWQQYNLVSPIALVLNIVIWLPIIVALFAGFGVLVLGPIVPQLGALCGWICDQSLGLIETCIDQAQRPAGNHFYLPPPAWWWVAIFYAVFLAWVLIPQLRGKRVLAGALLVGWFAIAYSTPSLASLLSSPKPDQPLRCTFVAVGHGTCCLLEMPDGRNLLYDAGKLGSPVGAVRPISAVLWSRGITHLDALVISHADTDHFNAIPELLQRYDIAVIYVSPQMFDQLDQPAVKELKAAIDRSGVPVQTISASDKLPTGDPESETAVQIEVLHPPALGVIGSDNANSIVLLVEHAGRKIILPGDLESPGLEDLLAELPIDTDIVMAPHHGSLRSDPKGFANWSRPEFVVLSGDRNIEDIPTIDAVMGSYSQVGSNVFHTAQHGCVTFMVTREKVEVETFRVVGP